jgi:hypothetical protein
VCFGNHYSLLRAFRESHSQAYGSRDGSLGEAGLVRLWRLPCIETTSNLAFLMEILGMAGLVCIDHCRFATSKVWDLPPFPLYLPEPTGDVSTLQ